MTSRRLKQHVKCRFPFFDYVLSSSPGLQKEEEDRGRVGESMENVAHHSDPSLFHFKSREEEEERRRRNEEYCSLAKLLPEFSGVTRLEWRSTARTKA